MDSSNVVVVRNTDTGKQQAIAFSDILVPDMASYYYYGQTSYSRFDAEGQLTSAVNLVTSAAHLHFSATPDTARLRWAVRSVPCWRRTTCPHSGRKSRARDGGIPENCEMLFSTNPPAISLRRLKQVQDYLVSGGQVTVTLSSETNAARFPNRNTLASQHMA